MIRKGIILAGGKGSRMSPLTKAVNKQLLPIYDKPLIYYPLSILMLAGIKEILVIVNKGQLSQFKKILSDGKRFGVKINYAEQNSPKGLPDAFIIGEKFIGKENVALILGDNFFYGQSLTIKLKNCVKLKSGCKVLLHPVKRPELYGVAKISKGNKIIALKEKPKNSSSNLAVTGLYFFDNNVIKLSKQLKPSKRKELEINDFYNTSSFVSALESRQGLKIACLEEIALNYNWINKKDIKKAINFYGNCIYSQYLKKLIQ